MKKLTSIILAAVLSFAPVIYSQPSPRPMLEKTSNDIIATLKKNRSNLKKNHDIIHQTVEQHLLPVVDVRGMARSVLGRQAWKKATKAEKRVFTREFTDLVIRTYASPLSEYSDETVKFLPIRGNINGRFVRVKSIIIRSSGQNIPLTYSLIWKHGEWKIYDFSVEGVSLLQSFRSQFSQVLQNSNMQALITKMRQKKAA